MQPGLYEREMAIVISGLDQTGFSSAWRLLPKRTGAVIPEWSMFVLKKKRKKKVYIDLQIIQISCNKSRNEIRRSRWCFGCRVSRYFLIIINKSLHYEHIIIIKLAFSFLC
jgi:hypothetical protein